MSTAVSPSHLLLVNVLSSLFQHDSVLSVPTAMSFDCLRELAPKIFPDRHRHPWPVVTVVNECRVPLSAFDPICLSSCPPLINSSYVSEYRYPTTANPWGHPRRIHHSSRAGLVLVCEQLQIFEWIITCPQNGVGRNGIVHWKQHAVEHLGWWASSEPNRSRHDMKCWLVLMRK